MDVGRFIVVPFVFIDSDAEREIDVLPGGITLPGFCPGHGCLKAISFKFARYVPCHC